LFVEAESKGDGEGERGESGPQGEKEERRLVFLCAALLLSYLSLIY
jgi:hypothetical protein